MLITSQRSPGQAQQGAVLGGAIGTITGIGMLAITHRASGVSAAPRALVADALKFVPFFALGAASGAALNELEGPDSRLLDAGIVAAFTGAGAVLMHTPGAPRPTAAIGAALFGSLALGGVAGYHLTKDL